MTQEEIKEMRQYIILIMALPDERRRAEEYKALCKKHDWEWTTYYLRSLPGEIQARVHPGNSASANGSGLTESDALYDAILTALYLLRQEEI